MDFSFTVYEPKTRRAKRVEPIAEVTTNGRIVFNRMAKELLQGKPYSILAVDKVNKAVGVLSADSKDANTFPIRYTAKGAYIGAKKFFKDIGLIPGSKIESTPVKTGEFIAIKL